MWGWGLGGARNIVPLMARGGGCRVLGLRGRAFFDHPAPDQGSEGLTH